MFIELLHFFVRQLGLRLIGYCSVLVLFSFFTCAFLKKYYVVLEKICPFVNKLHPMARITFGIPDRGSLSPSSIYELTNLWNLLLLSMELQRLIVLRCFRRENLACAVNSRTCIICCVTFVFVVAVSVIENQTSTSETFLHVTPLIVSKQQSSPVNYSQTRRSNKCEILMDQGTEKCSSCCKLVTSLFFLQNPEHP